MNGWGAPTVIDMALHLPLAGAAGSVLLAASLLAPPTEPVAVPPQIEHHAVALVSVIDAERVAGPVNPARAALHPVDAALQILPALAWAVVATPVAIVLFPLWAAQGFPTASATDPSRPDSGCGGPGFIAQCALRALLYYLVPGPYELLATRVGAFVGSLTPAAASAAAVRASQARPGAPAARVAQGVRAARPQTRPARAAAARPAARDERAGAERARDRAPAPTKAQAARRVGPRA